MNVEQKTNAVGQLLVEGIENTRDILFTLCDKRETSSDLRALFLSDKVARIFWLAFLWSLSSDLEKLFEISQEAQLLLKRCFRGQSIDQDRNVIINKSISLYSDLLSIAKALPSESIESLV